MSGHTPGPWFADHMEFGWQVGFDMPFGHRAGLAVILGWGQPSEQNARLIAAAPDLLQALEAIAEDHLWHYGAETHLAKTAMAAIAKAKGGGA